MWLWEEFTSPVSALIGPRLLHSRNLVKHSLLRDSAARLQGKAYDGHLSGVVRFPQRGLKGLVGWVRCAGNQILLMRFGIEQQGKELPTHLASASNDGNARE